MTSSIQNRSRILIAHGSLALCLGLALFYLRAVMTNRLFEALAVAIVLVLVAVTLILSGVVDWYAAWSEGLRHLQRLSFSVLAGLAMAVAGIFLGVYSEICMPILLLIAAFHALAFGLLAIIVAWKTAHHGLERSALYLFGMVSVAFSIVMTGVSTKLDNHLATTALGAYLCFVAAKLFCVAWAMARSAQLAEVHHEIGIPAHDNLSAAYRGSPAKSRT